jgi:hypothetical protein
MVEAALQAAPASSTLFMILFMENPFPDVFPMTLYSAFNDFRGT